MSNKRSSQFQGRPEEPFEEGPDREFEQRTRATAAQMAGRKIKAVRPRGSSRPASGIVVNANPSPFQGGFSQQAAAQPANTPSTSNFFGGFGSSQQPAQTDNNASTSNLFGFGATQSGAPSNNSLQAANSFNFAPQSPAPSFNNASASSSFPPFGQSQQSSAPSNTFSSASFTFGQQQPQQSAAPSNNSTSATSPFAFSASAGNKNATPNFAFGGSQNNASQFNFGQQQSQQPEVSQASGPFGNPGPPSSSTPSFGVQGTSAPAATPSFGGMFGQPAGQQDQHAQAPTPFGGFGQAAPNAPSFYSSGTNAPATTSGSGNLFNTTTFGQQSHSEQSPAMFGGFGQTPSSAPNFDTPATTAQTPMTTSGSLFNPPVGQQSQPNQSPVTFGGFGQTASSDAGSVFASTSAPAASATPAPLFQNLDTPAATTASKSLFQNLGTPAATTTPKSLFQNTSTPAANNTSSNIFGNLGSQGQSSQAPGSPVKETPQNVAGFSFPSSYQPATSSAPEVTMTSPERPAPTPKAHFQFQPQHQPEPEPESTNALTDTPSVSITAPEPVSEPETEPESTPVFARTTSRPTPGPESLLTAQSPVADIPKALVPPEWMQVAVPSTSHKDRVERLDRKLVDLTAQLATLNRSFKAKIINASPLADWAAFSRWHFIQSKDITTQMTEVRKERAQLNGVTGNESTLSKRKANEELDTAEQKGSPSKRPRGGQTTSQDLVEAKSPAKQPLNLFGGLNGTRSSAPSSNANTASNGAQGPLTSTLRQFKADDKANNNATSTTGQTESSPSLFGMSNNVSSPAPSQFSPIKPAISHAQNTPSSVAQASNSTPNPFASLQTARGQAQGTPSIFSKSSNAISGSANPFSAPKAAEGPSQQTSIFSQSSSGSSTTTSIFAQKATENQSKGNASPFSKSNNESTKPSSNIFSSGKTSFAPFSTSSSLGGSRLSSPAPSIPDGQSVFDTPSAAPSPAANIFGHLSGSSQDDEEEDDQDEEPLEDARIDEQSVEEDASDAEKPKSPPWKPFQTGSETESDTELHEEEARKTKTVRPSLADRMTRVSPEEAAELKKADLRDDGSVTPKSTSGAQTPMPRHQFDFKGAAAKAAQTAPPKSQTFAGDQTFKLGTPIKFGSDINKKDAASDSSFKFDSTKKSTSGSSFNFATATKEASSDLSSQPSGASFQFTPSNKKSNSSSFKLPSTTEKEATDDPFGFHKIAPATEQKEKAAGPFGFSNTPFKINPSTAKRDTTTSNFSFKATPSTENKENSGTPLFSFQTATPPPASTGTDPGTFSFLGKSSFLAPSAGTSGPGSVTSSGFSSRAVTPLSDTGDSAGETEDGANSGPQLDLSSLTEDEKKDYDVVFHANSALAQILDDKKYKPLARAPLWILRHKSSGKALVRMRIASGKTPVNYNIMPVLKAKRANSTTKLVQVSMPSPQGSIQTLYILLKTADAAEELMGVYNKNIPA